MARDVRRRLVLTGGVTALAFGLSQTIGIRAAIPQVVPPLLGPAPGGTLHVMTYNLRLPIDPPPRSWARRRPLVAELLQRERPTVLGVQEGTYGQLRELMADLGPPYDWIHLFSEGGSAGSAPAIIFDATRLEPLDYGHAWLSDEPRMIGSATWGNEVIRMLTWVRFVDIGTGRELIAINTHLDHLSTPSRRKSAAMLRRLVAELRTRWERPGRVHPMPIVLLGDFNTAADPSASETFRILTDDGRLTDTWQVAGEHRTPAYGTFNRFEPAPDELGRRIDWILATDEFETLAAAINTWTGERRVPSDHWPVQALLRLR